ncbi:MAG: indolepyruvate oxidoreductase subunit beta [Candidatus Aenigmatarchaeota archaeon]
MKEFNIVVTGIGGQGALTLGMFIAEAAVKQGYDVRTTELHGLAQRGGSIPVHIRLGENLHSAMVMEGEADLVMSLEPLEGLRSAIYGSKKRKTTFIIDSERFIPLTMSINGEKYPSMEEVKKSLEGFSSKVLVVNASEAAIKETGSSISANVFMIGYAVGKELIPIKKEFMLQALAEKKFFEVNKKLFEMGMNQKA